MSSIATIKTITMQKVIFPTNAPCTKILNSSKKEIHTNVTSHYN